MGNDLEIAGYSCDSADVFWRFGKAQSVNGSLFSFWQYQEVSVILLWMSALMLDNLDE